MEQLGTLIFQANDNTDIFYKTVVFADSVVEALDPLSGLDDIDWDNSPWVLGIYPKPQPVTVDGDTTVIYALFKPVPAEPYTLTIYVYYEETEELLSVEEEEVGA